MRKEPRPVRRAQLGRGRKRKDGNWRESVDCGALAHSLGPRERRPVATIRSLPHFDDLVGPRFATQCHLMSGIERRCATGRSGA
jgi:hypothetical protein